MKEMQEETRTYELTYKEGNDAKYEEIWEHCQENGINPWDISEEEYKTLENQIGKWIYKLVKEK